MGESTKYFQYSVLKLAFTYCDSIEFLGYVAENILKKQATSWYQKKIVTTYEVTDVAN
jgi:hypothetical protein